MISTTFDCELVTLFFAFVPNISCRLLIPSVPSPTIYLAEYGVFCSAAMHPSRRQHTRLATGTVHDTQLPGFIFAASLCHLVASR